MSEKADTTWREGVEFPAFPALQDDVTADVCIIGAGLCGTLTAYLLAKDGKKVVLLEKARLGKGVTGATTGFLTQAVDTDLSDLITMFGKDKARLVMESHGAAIDLVEEIALTEGIECEFKRTSNYLYAGSEKDMKTLARERNAANELGVHVRYGGDKALAFPNHGYLEFRNQAKFHPLKFMRGVVEKLQEIGVEIYEETEATELTEGALTSVKTSQGTVRAESVVSASYSPFLEPASLFLKKAMYISYIIELEVPTKTLPEAMFEDQENPYHYFRVDSGESADRVLVGGEDHRADIPIDESKNFQALEDFIKKTLGHVKSREVRRWKSGVLEPIDGLAFIGHNDKPQVQYAFAFSGSGMTYSPIAAMMLRDSILGRANPWSAVYDARRIPRPVPLAIKGRDYLGELMHGAGKNAMQYRKKDD